MSGSSDRKAGRDGRKAMPSGFVDKGKIEDFLNVVETGSDYLDSLITNENCNDPFAWTVQGYVMNVREQLKQLRKTLGKWPALLDQRHPAYMEMYAAAQKIAGEATRQRLDPMRAQRQQPAKRTRPAAEPLLLVPARPSELPVS
jgi:hypothetical protein